MGLIARFRQWKAARKERRIERLTARAADLNENQQYDLLFLHKRGFVRAKGSGQSITKVYADVENLIRKKLRVVVTPGTYFVSSGGHQNMATTTEYTFTLYPCSTQHLDINAACINANRPIPGKNDRFYGVARVSDNVARFLEASRSEDPMVIQAGVWTLTDSYSRYDVINHLISRDNRGNTWHPVTHDHCNKAKAILEKLGIPHRLWYSEVPYEKKSVDYDNGSYVGEFRHGEQHGRGKYTWKESGSYEGEWRGGEFHGEGIRIFKDGDKYVGKFENGREVGGWYHFSNGNREWCFRDEAGKWVIASPTSPRSEPPPSSTAPPDHVLSPSTLAQPTQTNEPQQISKEDKIDNLLKQAYQFAKEQNAKGAFETLAWLWDDLKDPLDPRYKKAMALYSRAYCPHCRIVYSNKTSHWLGAHMCAGCNKPWKFR